MAKSIGYRLFKLGSIPGPLRQELEGEGLLAVDEGIPGRLVMKDVSGPGRRHKRHKEGFSGFLAITERRILLHTYGKRQIHVAAGDPRLSSLYARVVGDCALALSFESGAFRDGWRGVMEFELRTPKARPLLEALLLSGVREGRAAD